MYSTPPMDLETSSRLTNYLKENLGRYISMLEAMVGINSFTKNPLGVNALGIYTAERFSELGFQSKYIQAADAQFGKHLVLRREGRRPETIGLISHLDTVFPEDEEQRHDFRWRPAGDRIYGPGTIDIKGGTMMIFMVLDAIKTLFPERFDEITWAVALNAAEEHLVEDFTSVARAAFGDSPIACLVFEAGDISDTPESFTLTSARKGYAEIILEATGRNSHAGQAHDQGANAVRQLAEIVSELEQITDYSKDLTVNVGIFRGGDAANRVPNSAIAELDVRAYSDEVLQSAIKKIKSYDGYSSVKSAADGYPCRISVQRVSIEASWPPNEGTQQILACYQSAGRELGFTVLGAKRGGLSDGNRLSLAIPTIDGLGPSGANAHCAERSPDGSKDQEYITVSTIVPKGLLNCAAILKLPIGS